MLEDVDYENMQVSSMVSPGEKKLQIFDWLYKHDDYKIKPLHTMLQKLSAFASYDGETKWMKFLIKDDLLKQ